ncbi:MAG: hypothetical protein PHD37_17210 [Gallionellaceae bacterium]|nr:hypothetical protein [Gallionellaceae bacterium]
MGIKEIWNTLEATLVKRGFAVVDVEDVQQGKRCVIRVSEVIGDHPARGTMASGVVRLTFALQVVLVYEWGGDARIERAVAEDAEDVVHAIYTDVNLSNHRFIGATIERDPARGVVTDTIRFDFQSQAEG